MRGGIRSATSSPVGSASTGVGLPSNWHTSMKCSCAAALSFNSDGRNFTMNPSSVTTCSALLPELCRCAVVPPPLSSSHSHPSALFNQCTQRTQEAHNFFLQLYLVHTIQTRFPFLRLMQYSVGRLPKNMQAGYVGVVG